MSRPQFPADHDLNVNQFGSPCDTWGRVLTIGLLSHE
jgi:hypothetical protein